MKLETYIYTHIHTTLSESQVQSGVLTWRVTWRLLLTWASVDVVEQNATWQDPAGVDRWPGTGASMKPAGVADVAAMPWSRESDEFADSDD